MSFWITIIKRPRLKEARKKAAIQGFIDLPEINVMIGEHGGIEGISGFVWDPEYVCEQCPDFDGALNDRISGKPREILVDMVRLALPKGYPQEAK